MNEQQILFEIAEDKTYETEYDGRMYENCAYCDCCQSESENHDKTCLMLEAREVLGDKWTAKKDQERAEREAQEEELAEWHRQHPSYPNHKIPCEFCQKKIWPTGMKHHQRDSVLCSEARKKAA